MNKRYLTAVIGLALASSIGLVNAGVRLYGQLDVSVDAYDQDSITVNGVRVLEGNDDVNLRSNTSAIGVKGAEDLGNGLEAFFKVEYQTDLANDRSAGADGGSSGWTGRDQYIGLGQEVAGKLAVGTMSTAYKAQAAKIDPFYRTSLQARDGRIGLQSALHRGKGEEGEGRATNTIGYSSPNWGGFGLLGTYTLDSEDNVDGEDDNPWSVGASFSGLGGLYAFVSYVTTNANGDDDATQIGAQYALGSLEFHGIYELDGGLITLQQYSGAVNQGAGTEPGTTNQGSGDGADIWSVGGSWTIGNNLFGFDYGQGDAADDPLIVTDNYTAWRIAAYHKFSDRTRVYGGYSNNDPDAGGEFDLFSVGMRHNF
jgi:predicted porin